MLTITITYDGTDREAARRAVESAGFTVTKVTAKRSTTTPGNVSRIGRASALTDMPTGLDKAARGAYVRGYATGCLKYTRKHGAPSITGDVIDRTELRRLTRAHEWDRHPTAHRAGMRELAAYLAHPARATVASLAVAS